MARPAPQHRPTIALLAAPLLIAAALAVWLISNQLVTIGPFDRAQIGWAVAVPLFLLAPGTAALAGRQAGGRAAAWLVGGISTALGILTIVGLLAIPLSIGCAPVTSPLQAVPNATFVGLASGLGFAVPAAAAWAARSRGPVIVLAVGALFAFGAILVTILAFAMAFVTGVSCAYVPPG
jgi:hypothetical protein